MSMTPNEVAGREGRKTSRAAEYVAALYIALVLLTPWLLRDVSWLTPPARGAEIQVVNRATAAHAGLPTERVSVRPLTK